MSQSLLLYIIVGLRGLPYSVQNQDSIHWKNVLKNILNTFLPLRAV